MLAPMQDRTGRLGAGLLLATLALVSCHRSEHPAADHWDAPAPRPEPPPPGPYPIGEACDASARRPPPDAGARVAFAPPTEQCGKGGRVAVITYLAASFPPLPPPAVQRGSTMEHVAVLVEGSRVSVETDCPVCRSDTWRLWIGDLALMTDEQIVGLQVVSRLPAKPLLTDGAAWERALATVKPDVPG
jgi:hypothetical protein